MARTNEIEAVHKTDSLTTPRVDKASTKNTVKFVEPKTAEKAGGPAKVCSGHLGKQLAAVRKDGRPYACGFGKVCTFAHVSIAGKSNQKLLSATILSDNSSGVSSDSCNREI
jgi:hypothetical protein